MIVAVTLACLAAATAVTASMPREYQAETVYFISSSNATSDVNAAMASSIYAQQKVASYAAVASSQAMAVAIRADLNLSLTPSQIQSKITTSVEYGTVLIHVIVTDQDRNRSLAISQSLARQYNQTLRSVDGKSGLAVSAAVLTEPKLPSSPSSPHVILNELIGFIAGLLLGFSVAALRDLLDNRIKTSEQVEQHFGLSVMGAIADDNKTSRHPIASRAGARSIRAEHFRQLRANLQFANVDEHPRVIAIASSLPAEGKTMVAINMASTLAEAGFTVCLVDADLRRPTIAKALGLTGRVGLTSVLIQQISLVDALQSAGVNLFVLASGPVPPNPSELLASHYLRSTIRSLLDRVDYVIVDTAPLLPVADGTELAALADGTLLVARHRTTTEPQLKRAVASLRRVDANLLGVVLNRVPTRGRSPYGYSYYRARETDSASAPSAAARSVGADDKAPVVSQAQD